MSGRKPPGVRWETWAERLIREGVERGDFDQLDGHGRPISDLDRPRDENWWLKRKLRGEGVSFPVPQLAIRDDRDETLSRLGPVETEDEVRAIVEALNDRIRHVNRTVIKGPPTTVMVLDVEQVLAEWRSARP